MPSIAETEMGEAANASSISAAGSRSVPVCSSTASSPTDSSQASFSASVSPRNHPLPDRNLHLPVSSIVVHCHASVTTIHPNSPHHPDTADTPTRA